MLFTRSLLVGGGWWVVGGGGDHAAARAVGTPTRRSLGTRISNPLTLASFFLFLVPRHRFRSAPLFFFFFSLLFFASNVLCRPSAVRQKRSLAHRWAHTRSCFPAAALPPSQRDRGRARGPGRHPHVRQLRHHVGPFLTHFPALHPHAPGACCTV